MDEPFSGLNNKSSFDVNNQLWANLVVVIVAFGRHPLATDIQTAVKFRTLQLIREGGREGGETKGGVRVYTILLALL